MNRLHSSIFKMLSLLLLFLASHAGLAQSTAKSSAPAKKTSTAKKPVKKKAPANSYIVKSQTASIRSEPSMAAGTTLVKLKYGNRVSVLGQHDNRWVKVSHKAKDPKGKLKTYVGYMPKELLMK